MKVLIFKQPLFYQVTIITPLLAKEGVGGGWVNYIVYIVSFFLLQTVTSFIKYHSFYEKILNSQFSIFHLQFAICNLPFAICQHLHSCPMVIYY